jgi:hypothetical protein
MAHWMLRERMAEHKRESNHDERNRGYDEAARGGPGVPSSDVGTNPDQPSRPEDPFDREAREAANDVRRRESSGR